VTPAALPLPFDPARVPGLSERLLVAHHANDYGGAVRRLNALRGQLAALDWSSAPGFLIDGVKREALVAANSVRLHELYFAGLGGTGMLSEGGLSVGLARDFGSIERWRIEFIALVAAMGGGSGWALLSWSARGQRLVNHWAADHTHLLAGATPLLALDMHEHAYQMDFGTDAGAYIEAVMRNIAWPGVGERYVSAVHASCGAFAASPQEVAADATALRIDVRRKGAYASSAEIIEGATWRDPERVDEWGPALRGEKVAVYCVYGHEVGQSTAARLRAVGVDARFLTGGIVGWKAAGRPLAAK